MPNIKNPAPRVGGNRAFANVKSLQKLDSANEYTTVLNEATDCALAAVVLQRPCHRDEHRREQIGGAA